MMDLTLILPKPGIGTVTSRHQTIAKTPYEYLNECAVLVGVQDQEVRIIRYSPVDVLAVQIIDVPTYCSIGSCGLVDQNVCFSGSPCRLSSFSSSLSSSLTNAIFFSIIVDEWSNFRFKLSTRVVSVAMRFLIADSVRPVVVADDDDSSSNFFMSNLGAERDSSIVWFSGQNPCFRTFHAFSRRWYAHWCVSYLEFVDGRRQRLLSQTYVAVFFVALVFFQCCFVVLLFVWHGYCRVVAERTATRRKHLRKNGYVG
jgi:hypothetical protein